MLDAIEATGLPDACVLHGLRKTAARIIAEVGGDISSFTGHLSASMEKAYARDAAQAKMARATLKEWGRNRR